MTIVKSDLRTATWCKTKTTPANILTHARTPLAILGIIGGLIGWSAQVSWPVEVGLGLLILSALTDTLDGKIARYLGCVSEYGGLLDTTQDKIFLVVVISSCLLPLARSDSLHACLLTLFLALNVWRDHYVMLLRFIGAAKGLSGQAQWFGKLRTISLMIFGCFLFAFAFNSGLTSFIPSTISLTICFTMEFLIALLTVATWSAYAKLYL